MKKIGDVWCKWPSNPKGLIEIIGGSYLGASPQLSYKRLTDGFFNKDIAVNLWSYIPGFNHQAQANQAWKNLRFCRNVLQNEIGPIQKVIRLGHSLGCKLHLLAPDGGRNCNALITLSFNNFNAEQSIPMMKELAPRIGASTEFNPSPKETMRIIQERYVQPKNLIISFSKDKLDQSQLLIECLNTRQVDSSVREKLIGDHLTPASAGVRQSIFGDWADDTNKINQLNHLVKLIIKWL